METHSLCPYCAPAQSSRLRFDRETRIVGLLALMFFTVLNVAGCADRPQARQDEAHDPCVVPRGGFHCEDQAKQHNFMRFEQQGHQLP
jgi:hypothetical protein